MKIDRPLGAPYTPRVMAAHAPLSYHSRKALWGLFFITPWVIGFLLFQLLPIVSSLLMSFAKYDIITPAKFIGFGNFVYMIKDPLFATSLLNTLYYVAMSVPFRVVVSLFLAMLLDRGLPGTGIFRTIYYLPSVTAGVAISALWKHIYQPNFGGLNSLLRVFGVAGPNWLFDTTWALPALMFMGTWVSAGRYMVIFLAGLQGVPQHLYESAEIDGASRWQQFYGITLPLLTPTVYLVSILTVIQSFMVFTHAYIMTNGGPANATLVSILYIYRKGFEDFQMGYASAQAWVLFVIILIITLVQKQMEKYVYYESAGGAS
jgi:multiple sugar transport system permease protein